MIIELATLETGSLMLPKQELNAGRILTLPTFIECFLLHTHIVVRMQHGFPYSHICSVALQQPFAAYMLQSLKLCCSIATTKNSIVGLSSTGFFVVVVLSSACDYAVGELHIACQ